MVKVTYNFFTVQLFRSCIPIPCVLFKLTHKLDNQLKNFLSSLHCIRVLYTTCYYYRNMGQKHNLLVEILS